MDIPNEPCFVWSSPECLKQANIDGPLLENGLDRPNDFRKLSGGGMRDRRLSRLTSPNGAFFESTRDLPCENRRYDLRRVTL